MSMNMKQYFVNNESIKARISEWGSKENSTIICIHGLGSTNLSFIELGELFGRIRFCASGDTARGAIKSMYDYPTNFLYDKLSVPILLLQATLPESWNDIRTLEVKEFQNGTNAVVKIIDGTTHMLHWDNPKLIEKELISWMN